jgi:hypothetical protein
MAVEAELRAARSIDWIPRFVRFPLVFGIVESKWSLQGGAHWSAASEWRGWRPDGVPSPGATSAKLVDSRQKRRCRRPTMCLACHRNARNDVLGGGEMAGHKAPVRLRLRVHGASIGLLEDGRAPCVMRHGITFDCRPFVHVGEQRVAYPRTRSFHGKEGVAGSSPAEGFPCPGR